MGRIDSPEKEEKKKKEKKRKKKKEGKRGATRVDKASLIFFGPCVQGSLHNNEEVQVLYFSNHMTLCY
jgi:hypothetical protein